MTGGKMWSNSSVKLLFCLIFLSGCMTYNTATGRNEMIFISTSSEVAMGNQINAELSSKSRIIEGTAESRRLENIGQRVARVSDRQDIQYHFHLIEDEDINAFTVPGGHIYFYTGLFRKMERDDQIAAVLAHEIGHNAGKHTVKKFQGALGYDMMRNLVLGVLELRAPGSGDIAGIGADGLMGLAMSGYSRHDEYEADRLGIKYLYLAGYDLSAMIQVFYVLQQNDKKGGPPLILRTHPFVKDRITAAQKEIEAIKAKY